MNTEVIITNASALTQNALKTLRTGAYIVQCDNAPSSFPVSNAYGILFHLGSLLNYSAFIFLGGGNVWDSFYSYTDDTWVAWRSLRTMYVDVNVTVTSGGAAQLNSASGGVLSYEKFIYGYVIDSNSLNARFHTYSNLLYVKLYTDTGVAAPAGTYKIRCWYRP